MNLTKIALEEHVAMPETVEATSFVGRPQLRNYLLDIHGRLLADMDAAGIEVSVLSLNCNGVQEIPEKRKAIDIARRGNDYLAEQVAKNPKRFQAFATLPLQDADAAAEELTRCINDLGFRGTLINGFSQIDVKESVYYYDLPQYWDFWGTVESLDTPVYLHPRDPLASWTKIYDGHPWLLSSRWCFTPETATHALRLMASGLFDKYPKLTIILGHLGETLPAVMWRIDHRIRCMPPVGIPATKPLDHYFRNNFYITTSGNFCTPTLTNAISWVGTDRILFSVDYPFEKMTEAAAWFDHLDLDRADWVKIARENAEKVLKLAAKPARAASD